MTIAERSFLPAHHHADSAQPLHSRVGRFCILGAGSSGLAVAKNFKQQGIAYDCLEREDEVGGNWYYGRPHSSVYRSARLISSKQQTEYGDFPMPREYPEHPDHEAVWRYLRGYAEHFDLYRNIRFNTSVEWLEPSADGGWEVTLSDGRRYRYRGVVIANGHNWDPRWPDYPGRFQGQVLHSAEYKTPDTLAGRRVLVVGGGNSGFDIAVESSSWAAQTFHSLRRSYPVLPRFYRGQPIDQCGLWMLRWRLPLWMRRLAAARVRRLVWNSPQYALVPRPDHQLFETHPVINSRWPDLVAHRAIDCKPDIERLEGRHVQFIDGTTERVDVIVYATGFKISFPFMDRAALNWQDGKPDLYLNMFHPQRDDLFVVGLIQPDSGQFGLVDCQAQLIARYVQGLQLERPAAQALCDRKQTDRPRLDGGVRYVRSPRHLLEVEHHSYRRMLLQWINRLSRD